MTMQKGLYKNDIYSIDTYFTNMEDISIDSIKLYYLTLLKNIKKDAWKDIYLYFTKNRTPQYESTTYISTKDAYTLVNGPTIYIANDVEKIANVNDFFAIGRNLRIGGVFEIEDVEGFEPMGRHARAILTQRGTGKGEHRRETKQGSRRFRLHGWSSWK